MRQLFLWKWRNIITLGVVAIVFVAASNARVILRIQNYFGIPGDYFEIGNAIIEKPSSWQLVSLREKKDDQIKLLGMFPWWLSLRRDSPPGERYFLFRVLSNNQNKEVAFFETSSQTNEKLKMIIQNINAVNIKPFCAAKIRRFHNYDALECRPETNNSEFVMYIPEIQLTVHVNPYEPDFVDSLSIGSK